MGAPISNGIMALARVIRSVCGHRTDLHICGDPTEQFGQHGRIANVATGNLDGSDLQRLFVDAPLGIMLGMPLPGRGCGSCATGGVSRHHACGRAIRLRPLP